MERSIGEVDADALAEAYRDSAPFYPVEEEAIGSLSKAFREGEYGKRDVEWVVRWYFRRRVEAIDQPERRAIESAVADADRKELRGRLWDAIDALDGVDQGEKVDQEDEVDQGGEADEVNEAADSPPHYRALDALTRIPGVDVAVGSAFLWFLEPDRHFVLGDREWEVVVALGDLEGPYPDAPTVDDYDRYLDAVRAVASDLDVDHWRLYQTVQQMYAEEFDD